MDRKGQGRNPKKGGAALGERIVGGHGMKGGRGRMIATAASVPTATDAIYAQDYYLSGIG